MASNVIEMFTLGLGLPVCDDGALIQQKVKEQTPRRLKDRNSTTSTIQAAADAWFKAAEALQNRRPQLLDVIYGFFESLADTGLSFAAASGQRTLTAETKKKLLDIAFRECKADDDVADQFVRRFTQIRGLQEGEPLVRPSPVGSFSATSGRGTIALNWTLPVSQCDEVVIAREHDSGRWEQEIYRGTATSFVDSAGLEPGNRYRYRIRSVYRGVEGPDRLERAVCPGGVLNSNARWSKGQVELQWKLPVDDVSVVIFRQAGGPPGVRQGSSGLEATTSLTHRVHEGSETSWIDHDIVEGTTYYYRIFSDFGQNVLGDGVDVQVTIPKPPPAIPSLSGRYERHEGKDLVVLEWAAVEGVPGEYLIVRREGSAPAGNLQEGQLLDATTHTRFLDQTVEAGHRYCYAVFTRVGDLVSRTGTPATPIDILAEVSGLTADAGSGAAELAWETPAHVSDVIVRRSLTRPRSHTDGTPVALSGTGHAKDEGLVNGRQYHYLVCCVYRPDGITEVVSAGVRISVVPEQLPEAVSDFTAQVEGQEVLCTWQHSGPGQVIVVRSTSAPEIAVGTRLSANAANAIGSRIVATQAGQAIDSHPDITRPWYSVLTVAGDKAVLGGVASAVVCADVRHLRLSATRDGVILRWAWPSTSKMVRIVRRADDWPSGPDDPAATSVACSHVEYLSAGEKFIDVVHERRARFHYVVYAQPVGAPGTFFAPGKDAGCRGVIQWEPWMTLRYRLSRARKGSQKGTALRLTWDVEEPFADFSGFILVASQTAVPNAPDDGIELFRWQPTEHVAGSYEAPVSLEPITRRRWARFFVKAMVIDQAQAHTTLIVHPNTSRSILETGEMDEQRANGAIKTYRPGVPKAIVCPHCFDEFKVGEMRFSFDDGEAFPADHNWLDRLLGRPPRPPKDEQGRKMTQKRCRNGHVLPYSAGSQGSLVIGLIGAKFSGKSHYIASLINRLESQVGSDLQAALLHVTEETRKRYTKEFYQPLFGSCLELPVTIGTPPPLIYDLSLDGRLWGDKRNRLVTLSLYDTAGENLQSRETVQQMLKYLRVASGIIFLIDPLQVPAVRDALPSTVRPPVVDPEAEPSAILGRVLQELEGGKLLAQSGSLNTPVAVVLTKCDVLRDAGLIESNRLWNSDARHVGYFDRDAHDDMSGMMAEYVQRWSPAAYQIVSHRFVRHAFFGASATGCASDLKTRRYKYVSPWRVEDPLLWLLSELGVLPSRASAGAA
jgi:hypothetical protein